MAKRRNPKKEKALRNQAYARKFRKRKTNGRFSKRRYQGGMKKTTDEEGDNQWDGSGNGQAGNGGESGSFRGNYQEDRRRGGFGMAQGSLV